MASPSVYCVGCGCDIVNSKSNRMVRQHRHDMFYHCGVLKNEPLLQIQYRYLPTLLIYEKICTSYAVNNNTVISLVLQDSRNFTQVWYAGQTRPLISVHFVHAIKSKGLATPDYRTCETGSNNYRPISESTLLFFSSLLCVSTSYKAIKYLLQYLCKSYFNHFYITLTMVYDMLLSNQSKLRIFQKTLWIHAKVIVFHHGASIYFILVIRIIIRKNSNV